MNELLTNLAAQCTSESIDGPYATPYLDQEKFAMLIVNECLAQVHKIRTTIESHGPDKEARASAIRSCLIITGRQIENHFGVNQ
jgi:hypothetical protein